MDGSRSGLALSRPKITPVSEAHKPVEWAGGKSHSIEWANRNFLHSHSIVAFAIRHRMGKMRRMRSLCPFDIECEGRSPFDDRMRRATLIVGSIESRWALRARVRSNRARVLRHSSVESRCPLLALPHVHLLRRVMLVVCPQRVTARRKSIIEKRHLRSYLIRGSRELRDRVSAPRRKNGL